MVKYKNQVEHITCLEVIKLKGPKTRFIVGVGIVLVALFSIFCTKNAWLFRLLFEGAIVMALLEVASIYRSTPSIWPSATPNCALVVLSASLMFGFCLDIPSILLVCVGASLTDAFAYFAGSLLHGKFIQSKPFPKTSPNKSWEGIIGGVIGGIAATTLYIYLTRHHLNLTSKDVAFLILVTPAAIIGDWMESHLKREAGIKDANDFLKEHWLLKYPEKLLGGKDGHGGFYDRFDSISLVSCVYLFLTLLYG